MEDNSVNNDLNQNEKASITKFSSDLVKRSIDDLEKIYTGSFPIIRKPKILIVVDLDFGKFLKGILNDLDYEVNTIESSGQLDVIYLELSRTKYEIVILTNTTMTATHIIPVVPEIKKRFPNIRIIVISGDAREEYIKELYDLQIESFLKIPLEASHFKQIITKQTLTESTPSKITKKINSTKKTPEVIIDQDGIIQIKGRLIPENAYDFFCLLEDNIKKILCDPIDSLCLNIYLESINGDGTKYFLNFLNKLSHLKLNVKKITINWYYNVDNEDIYEKGMQLSAVLDLQFNFIIIR